MKKFILVIFCAFITFSRAFASAPEEKEVLVVGTESTYPPYEFRSPENELMGFHVDLVEAIGRMIGKKIEWVDMSFDSLIPSLLMGKLDMIGAGFLMTEARREKVAFTIPYEVSRGAVITLPENAARVKSLDDLNGKTVATQLGSYLESVCINHGGMDLKAFKKFDDCLLEVIYGRAYACTMGLVAAKKYLKAENFAGKVEMAFVYDLEGTENKKGFALRKEDTKFKEILDDAITKLEKSGELDSLKLKWDLL